MVRDVGTVGVLRDGYREVEKGIEPGDWVVVSGMQRLRPGTEVKAEKYDETAPPNATGKAGQAEGTTAAAGHETRRSPPVRPAKLQERPAIDRDTRPRPPGP